MSPLSALCISHNVAHSEAAARLRALITSRDKAWAEEESSGGAGKTMHQANDEVEGGG